MRQKKMKTTTLKMLMEIKTRRNFCEYQYPKAEKSATGNRVYNVETTLAVG